MRVIRDALACITAAVIAAIVRAVPAGGSPLHILFTAWPVLLVLTVGSLAL